MPKSLQFPAIASLTEKGILCLVATILRMRKQSCQWTQPFCSHQPRSLRLELVGRGDAKPFGFGFPSWALWKLLPMIHPIRASTTLICQAILLTHRQDPRLPENSHSRPGNPKFGQNCQTAITTSIRSWYFALPNKRIGVEIQGVILRTQLWST